MSVLGFASPRLARVGRLHLLPPALVLAATTASLSMAPARASAQSLTRPARAWETIETQHFRVHYPREMQRWVRPMAERLESVGAAVNALVGSAPSRPVTVMVEDPAAVSNGFAVPLLEGPVIFLWPTPPTPAPSFGDHRGWGEVLAVHEYGHIAHLTIPSRNAGERLVWRLLPSRVGPVARKSPAWVIEGYATYIEGKLTGNGRPHSSGRAAILRQWALEGRLPTYGQLNAATPFLGGSMRYLVGSAFLEWLVERKGDASLTHLWRRMSARERRSFEEAFRGVYGAGPDDLYGAFFTEVMEKALEARRQLQVAGLAEGTLVQKRAWATGEPALSPDGARVAVVVRQPNAPSRLVVWSARDEPLDSSVIRARQAMIRRDSLDVLPFDSFPAPRRVQRTLHPAGGRSHENPRWFADNERLLVSRDEPLGDGATRPDLFIWNSRRGGVRRVTRGAGIRAADPHPDGATAAAVRCDGGVCDLVRVDLRTGRWTVLAAGSPFVTWHRPRWSPDGRRIAASVHRDGRWWTFVVDAATGVAAPVDPGDGANRHSPSWTRDGRLVVVSDRGGVPNLELLDPATGAPRSLTRVLGALSAPEVAPNGDVWYLSLHAKGHDVRRLSLAATPGAGAERVVALPPSLSPAAARPRAAGVTFAPQPIRGPAEYGVGPRGWRVLPGVTLGPDGDMASLMVANIDPVGRVSVVAQGGYGQRGAWRGGSLAMALRQLPVQVEASAWYTEHDPSDQAAGSFASLDIDSRFTGLGLAARHAREGGILGYALRAGGSLAQVNGNQLDGAGRAMGFAELRARLRWSWRNLQVSPQVAATVAQGGTGGDSWTRTVSTGALALGGPRRALRFEGTVAATTTAGPGEFGRAFEQFAVGGTELPLVDPVYLTQRIPLPSVPVGYASGRKLGIGRVSARVRGFQPYAAWIAAGDKLTRYQRVLGAEQELEVSGLSFARLPTTRLRFGVGYSMDEPYKEKIRPYLSLTYRP